MENPQFVCRVGRTPTFESKLLIGPVLVGGGIKLKRVFEVVLKQDVGIVLFGHGCPGAGAVQPAGAIKFWGTKTVGVLAGRPMDAG